MRSPLITYVRLVAAIVSFTSTAPVNASSGLGYAQVVLANRVGAAGIDAPIYLPDGRGAGDHPGMVAQLFLVQSGQLIALEPQTTFLVSSHPEASAYLLHATSKSIQGLSPGDFATFRLRVWEKPKGVTYEESSASGGFYGETELTIEVGGGLVPPSNLVGLQSFTLSRLETLVIGSDSANVLSLHLDSSEPGHFTLESSSDLIHWTPVPLAAIHTTNSVTLTPAGSTQLFYRAVIHD